MPSKGRWALNPRKWFGTIANAAHRRDRRPPPAQLAPPPPPPPPLPVYKSLAPALPRSTRLVPPKPPAPTLLATRHQAKVMPASSMKDHSYTNATNAVASFTQFQLPAFNARREKTSTFLSSTALFNRANTFVPTRTEPSIRKNNQFSEALSVDAATWHTQTVVCDASNLQFPSSTPLQDRQRALHHLTEKRSDISVLNISEQCLIDYPHHPSNKLLGKYSSSTRSRSSSSLDDNDEQDRSSSSGIFTDERADIPHRHRSASKDTSSTLDVLSIESVADSQISLNQGAFRSSIQRYRLPTSTNESIAPKPSQPQRETSTIRPQRSHSAEGILKDSPTYTPVITKSRQSSAAIAKKIEKRIPTSRSPPATLEKAGFVRIANDTYRLTNDKDNHFHHRQRQNSVIQCSHYDDTLPSANDEECYATLPRTSSTENLDQNLDDHLRAMVHDCLRPVMASKNKDLYRSVKAPHRAKRSQITYEHSPINIEDITDKLLSSIDCAIYAQYQRCY